MMYSSGRSLPGSSASTFFDSERWMSLVTATEAEAPSGTAWKPGRAAASASAPKSCPAASKISRATSCRIHPSTATRPMFPSTAA